MNETVYEEETDFLTEAGDGDDETPTDVVMTVAGKEYAVGLFWQPLHDMDSPVSEVREAASGILEGADLYAIRQGTAPQYALGVSEIGHKPGLPAAAPAVADSFSDKASLVGVLRADNGWWFIAVRNDLILSEEDVLYLNEEDAQRAFYAMMAVPDWGYKFAPEEWGVDGAIQVDLDELLSTSKLSKLQKVGSGGRSKMLLGVAAIALLGLVGYGLYDLMFASQPEPKSKIVKSAAIFNKSKPTTTSPIPQAAPEIAPYEELFNVGAMLQRCSEEIRRINIITPGWDISPIECTGSAVYTTWKRKYGNLSYLHMALADENLKLNQLIPNETATLVFGLLSIQDIPRKRSMPQFTVVQLREELNDIFQSIAVPVTLAEATNRQATEKERLTGLQASERDRKVKYPALQFKFESSFEPTQWSPILTRFPALEMGRIIFNPGDGRWIYEGKIYERAQT